MIESLKNNIVVNIKNQVKDNQIVLLDTIILIDEAIANNFSPIHILISDLNLVEKYSKFNCTIVKPIIIEKLSNVETHSGIIMAIKSFDEQPTTPTGNFLVLEKLQDPGNVGTLIRSAVSARFTEIYLIDSCSLNSLKVIRASAGAIFKCKIYTFKNLTSFLKLVEHLTIPLYATDMLGENLFDCQFPEFIGVALGNEGSGISIELKSKCTKTISVPMENVESLNVGVAGSVIMINKTFGGVANVRA